MATTVFCVFEGGGAKGVMHLSTLRGLEDLAADYDLALRGFSGTSAGAIMAALAAAGWRAHGMFDHSGDSVQSAALAAVGRGGATSLLDLFDAPARRRLRVLIGISDLLGSRSWRRVLAVVGALILARLLWLWPHATLLVLVPIAVLLWWLLTRFRGCVSLGSIETLIDALLAAKLPGAARPVTFADLHRHSGMELAIIAAQLEGGQMVMFDRRQSPDVAVARAVAASAAIPLVFVPVEVGGRDLCDGGIVSNLPAWVFDAPMSADPSALIVTSENGGVLPATAAPARGLRLVWRVLRAALFGARVLETRGLRSHLALPLGTGHIRTRDFRHTARHIAELPMLDAALRRRIELHLLDMEGVQARYDFYVANLARALGPEVTEGLVWVGMLKNDETAGLTPWHAAGKRDCRWQPYGELIGRAAKGGTALAAMTPAPGDSQWCVALPGSGGLTAAIACLGTGAVEQLDAIRASLWEAELGFREARHTS